MTMALWLAKTPLVLASASEVRRKVLEAAGIPLDVKPASIDERGVEAVAKPGNPRAAALLLAQEKARAVSATAPGRVVLGADQTLSLGDERFSKPKDRAAAAAQLRKFSGKTHELHSACAVVVDGAIKFEYADSVRLTMRKLGDEFIAQYIETAGDAATASVGAYQIESVGVQLFERIEGHYFSILGLPLLPLLAYFRRDGLLME
jgi:septum formation protein